MLFNHRLEFSISWVEYESVFPTNSQVMPMLLWVGRKLSVQRFFRRDVNVECASGAGQIKSGEGRHMPGKENSFCKGSMEQVGLAYLRESDVE